MTTLQENGPIEKADTLYLIESADSIAAMAEFTQQLAHVVPWFFTRGVLPVARQSHLSGGGIRAVRESAGEPPCGR